jgi:hypothetical protein
VSENHIANPFAKHACIESGHPPLSENHIANPFAKHACIESGHPPLRNLKIPYNN